MEGLGAGRGVGEMHREERGADGGKCERYAKRKVYTRDAGKEGRKECESCREAGWKGPSGR